MWQTRKAEYVKRLSCRKVSSGGMVYSCTCISCKLAVEEKVSMYHGRSARTLYTRQGEHIGGCQAGKVDNALFKHAQLHHQGLVPEFQLPVPDATSAQIFEGISINHSPSPDGYLMNSKAEYQQGEVARVVVVRGLAEWLDDKFVWLPGGATLGWSQEGGDIFPVWAESKLWLNHKSFKSCGGGVEGSHPVTWAQRGGNSLITPGSKHSLKTFFYFVSLTIFINFKGFIVLQSTWWGDNNRHESLCK